MAHFALLDSKNKVIFVTVVANEKIIKDGIEVEQLGIDFLFNTVKIQSLYPEAVTAKQTSYNANFRNKYAGFGDTFDSEKDAFISDKPSNPSEEMILELGEWILNETTFNWEYSGKLKPLLNANA